MANAQADADAACLRLINTNHANISFANASYPDVMLASRAEKRLLYQLVPEQLTEMCQTISDHLVANPNMPAADRDLAERVMDKYADQRTAHIPAIYLLSQRMYQVPARIGNDELLEMATPPAPGAVVPAQVLNWLNFRVEIKHAITMNNVREHGIAFGEGSNFRDASFNTKCSNIEAEDFFANTEDGEGILQFIVKVLKKYWAVEFKSPNRRFKVRQQKTSTVLLRPDFVVSLDGEDLVVFELKAPDCMQSEFMNRNIPTQGNLVRGYYGPNYSPAASTGNRNAVIPQRLTQNQLDAPIDENNVDLQAPAGDEHTRRSVYQIAGYMVAFQRKYGVLSTCEMTWLLKMEPDGRLFVSPGLNGAGVGISTDSPAALLMSFLTHVAREAETNNGHRMVVENPSRFYSYLSDYWTTFPREARHQRTQNRKNQIVQEMVNAWNALQQAQQQQGGNNNNNNNNGGQGGGGGNQGNGGQGGQGGQGGHGGQPPGAGAGGGAGGNVPGAGVNAALIPANIIDNLENAYVSVSENLFAIKKLEGDAARLALIDNLPLKQICIGFPWELLEKHPNTDLYDQSIKMTVSGIPLVLKMLDKEEEGSEGQFLNEIDMYKGPLRSLQGVCAPYLFYASESTESPQILVTSREGSPVGTMPRAVKKQEFVQEGMFKALTTLHENGITHGHISFSAFHMVVVNESTRFYITDFGDAVYEPKHTAEFKRSCAHDLHRLRESIRSLDMRGSME